jgi:hypothetical protein
LAFFQGQSAETASLALDSEGHRWQLPVGQLFELDVKFVGHHGAVEAGFGVVQAQVDGALWSGVEAVLQGRAVLFVPVDAPGGAGGGDLDESLWCGTVEWLAHQVR